MDKRRAITLINTAKFQQENYEGLGCAFSCSGMECRDCIYASATEGDGLTKDQRLIEIFNVLTPTMNGCIDE